MRKKCLTWPQKKRSCGIIYSNKTFGPRLRYRYRKWRSLFSTVQKVYILRHAKPVLSFSCQRINGCPDKQSGTAKSFILVRRRRKGSVMLYAKQEQLWKKSLRPFAGMSHRLGRFFTPVSSVCLAAFRITVVFRTVKTARSVHARHGDSHTGSSGNRENQRKITALFPS